MKLAYVSLAIGALIMGCTTTIIHDDPSAGGSGGSGGSGAGGTGAGGTGAGGTGGGDVCAAYNDQAIASSVLVRVINQSDRDLYFPAGCGAIPYSISPVVDEEAGLLYDYDRTCLTTCQMFREGTSGACPDCAPLVERVPVGGVYEDVWDGTALRRIQMEARCSPEGTAIDCERIEVVPAREYRFSVHAWDECPDCGCDDGDDEQCWGTPGGFEADAMATAFFPEAGVVEVVFEGCAFGCP
jgi:hypothetical protein